MNFPSLFRDKETNKENLKESRCRENIVSGIEHIRVLLTCHSTGVFEELGFKYFGPIDGHDIGDLIEALNLAK